MPLMVVSTVDLQLTPLYEGYWNKQLSLKVPIKKGRCAKVWRPCWPHSFWNQLPMKHRIEITQQNWGGEHSAWVSFLFEQSVAPRLQMRGSVSPFPLHAFVEWCIIKQRKQFILLLIITQEHSTQYNVKWKETVLIHTPAYFGQSWLYAGRNLYGPT